MRTVEVCIVCGHGPLVLSHLYDHLRKSHSWNETQIDEEKLRIRSKKGSLRCDICDRIYSTLHSLRHHKLKAHPSGKTSSNVICPECGQRFYTYRDLAKHCSDWHTTKPATQDYSIITGQFNSFTAFEGTELSYTPPIPRMLPGSAHSLTRSHEATNRTEWKDSLESSSLTNFSKRYSVHCKDGGRRHVFVCKHARGKLMSSPGAEQSPNTPSHSKRILSHCPAFLRVSEAADGSVSYEGCIGHLGHVVCAASLRIPKTDQEEILHMLRRGLHAYEIVAKIRRERWNHSLGSDQQARICYVEAKDIWRMAHRHGLVQRRYRTAKRLAAAEAGRNSESGGPSEEVLPSDDFDYHVEEIIDTTEEGNRTPETAPMFWQTMQRVDTAAIEAFQTFQEINRFVNELMEVCVRNNQHELISQMNSTMMTKANEIARATGVDAELFLRRTPTVSQLIAKESPQNPHKKIVIVDLDDEEDTETKPPRECRSQFSLEDVLRQESDVINTDGTSVIAKDDEVSHTIDNPVL